MPLESSLMNKGKTEVDHCKLLRIRDILVDQLIFLIIRIPKRTLRLICRELEVRRNKTPNITMTKHLTIWILQSIHWQICRNLSFQIKFFLKTRMLSVRMTRWKTNQVILTQIIKLHCLDSLMLQNIKERVIRPRECKYSSKWV